MDNTPELAEQPPENGPTPLVPNNEPIFQPTSKVSFIHLVGWFCAITLVLVTLGLYLGFIPFPPIAATPATLPAANTPAPTVDLSAAKLGDLPPVPPTLPDFPPEAAHTSLNRSTTLITTIPTRSRVRTIKYTVESGDSVFSIAQNHGLEPETVLWANYDLLKDTPHSLDIGMELNIPPVNGVYYKWVRGDTFESVASDFNADPEDIITFPGNRLDLGEPNVTEGTMVMVPGGQRAFQQWLIPTIARENTGVSASTLGPGACGGGYSGSVGSGAFVWPTSNHYVSGNDYWSGHLAIDLAASIGDPIYAADSGVIVFSGWANGGYGNTIMVDHGNGYQTLYAHLNAVARGCGASVGAGNLVGYAGSTGNSTGPHLHFEVR